MAFPNMMEVNRRQNTLLDPDEMDTPTSSSDKSGNTDGSDDRMARMDVGPEDDSRIVYGRVTTFIVIRILGCVT